MQPDCTYYKLFDGKLDLRYCDEKHLYHVRPAEPGFVIKESPEMEANKGWLYTPSVTTVTRMLGGGKVEGLLWWAVGQTLEHLDKQLESELIVPSIDRTLDCFVERISEASGGTNAISASTLEQVLNGLDNCVSMDEASWKLLRAEAAQARDRSLADAANIGNLVHNWIEAHILYQMGLGDSPPIPDDVVVSRAIKKFLKWEQANAVEWLLTEQRVYSNEWHYTGTLDAVAVIGGKTTLIDFKTSKKIYDEHRFQTAAYWKALLEEYEIQLDQRMIIRLSKKTGHVSPKVIDGEGMPTVDDDFAAFIGLRQVYRRLKGA